MFLGNYAHKKVLFFRKLIIKGYVLFTSLGILAIYAVKVTTAEEGSEVVTVDEEKAEIIREVFWDMTEIVYETESYEDIDTIETTDEQGNNIEQEVIVTKIRLIVSTNSKSLNEVMSEYNFDENQKYYMEEIIKEDNNNLWSSILDFKN